MSSIYEQTSVITSARAVPRSVLVVDDNTAFLDEVATLLTAQDIDVTRATNGEEAITLLARRWIPLIVTDDEMPVMDGIELTHRVRAMTVKPTYVIMLLSVLDGSAMERGYCAGVDHYVSRGGWQASLPVRITEGFKAIRLRRGVKQKLRNDSVVTVDLASGAHTARHLVGRLSAEIMLAQRRSSRVGVTAVGLHATTQSRNNAASVISDEQLSAILGALKGAIRPQLDWVAWLHQMAGSHRFLVVSSSPSVEPRALEQSIRNAFVLSGNTATLNAPPLNLSFGTALFEPTTGSRPPTALELLGKAESIRRAAKDAIKSGIGAVQPDDA